MPKTIWYEQRAFFSLSIDLTVLKQEITKEKLK